jgi:hypothetical protein
MTGTARTAAINTAFSAVLLAYPRVFERGEDEERRGFNQLRADRDDHCAPVVLEGLHDRNLRLCFLGLNPLE